jgi:hypothetical protein
MLNIMNEPNSNDTTMQYPTHHDQHDAPRTVTNGPVLAVLILVLLILLGGLYYWFITLSVAPSMAPTPIRPTAEQNNEPESTTAEVQTETLGVMSTSNELDAIEADVEATNLDTLDAELQAIDAELEAALESL